MVGKVGCCQESRRLPQYDAQGWPEWSLWVGWEGKIFQINKDIQVPAFLTPHVSLRGPRSNLAA